MFGLKILIDSFVNFAGGLFSLINFIRERNEARKKYDAREKLGARCAQVKISLKCGIPGNGEP